MKAKKLLFVVSVILMSVCIPQYASASDAGRGEPRRVELPNPDVPRNPPFEHKSTTLIDLIRDLLNK